jgi:hypothetical protein
MNPARRIVESVTAPVTAPATEECHQNQWRTADEGALCGEASREEAVKKKNQAEGLSSRHWRKSCGPGVSRHPYGPSNSS